MKTNRTTNNTNSAIPQSSTTVALSLAGALAVTIAILAGLSNIADTQVKRVAYESGPIAATTSARVSAAEQITVTATRLVNTNTASIGMLKKATPPKALM